MADVKYQVLEFTPREGQLGTHGFYVKSKTDNVITNKELARKIESRGISRASEIKMILEEAAKVILEEVSENNRVQLETGDGVLVTVSPKASGSISDKEVRENPEKYNNAQVATADMLTPDRITWSLKAEVGTKFSKQFALGKTARRWGDVEQGSAEDAQQNGADTGSNGGNGGGDENLEG